MAFLPPLCPHIKFLLHIHTILYSLHLWNHNTTSHIHSYEEILLFFHRASVVIDCEPHYDVAYADIRPPLPEKPPGAFLHNNNTIHGSLMRPPNPRRTRSHHWEVPPPLPRREYNRPVSNSETDYTMETVPLQQDLLLDNVPNSVILLPEGQTSMTD